MLDMHTSIVNRASYGYVTRKESIVKNRYKFLQGNFKNGGDFYGGDVCPINFQVNLLRLTMMMMIFFLNLSSVLEI